jgi:hypothetical protein
VVRYIKTPKRPYKAPSFEVLDISAAKAQLDTTTTSKDEGARDMLSVIERRRKGNSARFRSLDS